jgi:hypothetical protein
MKLIVVVVLSLILGTAGGIFVHSKFSRKTQPTSISIFQETIKVEHLQLINQFYQNLAFIHKKGDPKKRLKVIVIIPVKVSSYIDLEQLDIQQKGDTIAKIVIPDPKIDSPILFDFANMQMINVPEPLIHIGTNQEGEFLTVFKQTIQQESAKMASIAIANGILDQTRVDAKNYIVSLLEGLKIKNVTVEFANKQQGAATQFPVHSPDTTQGVQSQNRVGKLIDSMGLKSIQ